jgi:hypothetical protein
MGEIAAGLPAAVDAPAPAMRTRRHCACLFDQGEAVAGIDDTYQAPA